MSAVDLVIIKVDPAKRIVARLTVPPKMERLRTMIGARRTGKAALGLHRGATLVVLAAMEPNPHAPGWAIKDLGEGIRGTGIIYSDIGFGPADVSASAEWVRERILWLPPANPLIVRGGKDDVQGTAIPVRP